MFAKVENAIVRTLQRLSKVSVEVAQAIFSGVRSEGAIQNINRILEISDPINDANRKRFSRAFEQFRHINDVRNLLLHHGIESSGKDLVTTNRKTALTESRVRSIPISAETLEQMTEDLGKIDALLTLTAIARGGDLEDADAIYRELQKPWLYKPPRQSPRARPKTPNAPK
jgi:hypothetical protein